jgi:hypothetical protein
MHLALARTSHRTNSLSQLQQDIIINVRRSSHEVCCFVQLEQKLEYVDTFCYEVLNMQFDSSRSCGSRAVPC